MKLTLGKRLALGFAAILGLMVLSAATNYVKSTNIRKSQDAAVNLRFPALETARELQRDLNYTQVKGRQAILGGTDPIYVTQLYRENLLHHSPLPLVSGAAVKVNHHRCRWKPRVPRHGIAVDRSTLARVIPNEWMKVSLI